MSETANLATEFAPAARASDAEVQQHFRQLHTLPLAKELLNAMPHMTIILNRERQIVFANQAFLRFIDLPDFPANPSLAATPSPIGMRPGEAINCKHAHAAGHSCGSSASCSTCGAINAVLQSQRTQEPSVEECRMTTLMNNREYATDLRVWANPIEIHGYPFTICSMVDISEEKRRHVHERIFFHDVLNTAGAMQGLTSILAEEQTGNSDLQEVIQVLHSASGDLVEEIEAQRVLNAAEHGELTVESTPINSYELLRSICKKMVRHEVAVSKSIVVSDNAALTDFCSDHHLLRRALVNLTKNALEASREGATITLNCREDGDNLVFSVHNKSVIPPEAQLQIFNRSFSTKGANRGIGTYSIKLLTERYLGGQVSFTSSAESGTLFNITLPRDLPQRKA